MWSAPVMFCHPSTGRILKVCSCDDGIHTLQQLGPLLPTPIRVAAFRAIRQRDPLSSSEHGRQGFAAALATVFHVYAPKPVSSGVDAESNVSKIDDYLKVSMSTTQSKQVRH